MTSGVCGRTGLPFDPKKAAAVRAARKAEAKALHDRAIKQEIRDGIANAKKKEAAIQARKKLRQEGKLLDQTNACYREHTPLQIAKAGPMIQAQACYDDINYRCFD